MGIAVVLVVAMAVGGYIFFINPIDPQSETPEAPVLHVYPNRLGSESAPITIFEYGDYQCPNCAAFNRNVMGQLIQSYVDTGIVKIYFRDFAYYGPDSITAAMAARCAGDQDMYWEYHHALYLAQGPINSGWANSTNLKALFYSQAVEDVVGNPSNEIFTECIDSERYRNEVLLSYQNGLKEGVGATPTFIIIGPDGREDVIVGPQPFRSFERVIESILSG